MSGKGSQDARVWTLTRAIRGDNKIGLRTVLAIFLAALCAAALPSRAQDVAPATDSARPDDSFDDPESEQEVEKSAAELEAVRKAEEKAGLLPQAPGAGPRDGMAVGLDPTDPMARDLAAALGTGVDGSPLAEPMPGGSVSVQLPELLGISEEELR